jgi:hypothetical protein
VSRWARRTDTPQQCHIPGPRCGPAPGPGAGGDGADPMARLAQGRRRSPRTSLAASPCQCSEPSPQGCCGHDKSLLGPTSDNCRRAHATFAMQPVGRPAGSPACQLPPSPPKDQQGLLLFIAGSRGAAFLRGWRRASRRSRPLGRGSRPWLPPQLHVHAHSQQACAGPSRPHVNWATSPPPQEWQERHQEGLDVAGDGSLG